MPSYQIQMPDGKKYKVDGPEGYTQEQAYRDLSGHLGQSPQNPEGNTAGGDIARGFAHGAASSLGMSGLTNDEPKGPNESWARWGGERVGEAVPPIAAGLIPGGPAVKTAIGAGMGALQPADSLSEHARNALIGAASAWGAGKFAAAPQRVKTGINRLTEAGAGYMLGGHTGVPFGEYGGIFAGPFLGRQIENIFGGGLGDLVAYAARNPGLAAYLGIKAEPGVEQAGKAVGDYLGQPSQ